MQTIKSFPLVMAMAGVITTFNSYADNNTSNPSAIPYSNTTETAGFYLSGQFGTQLTAANLNTRWIANDPKTAVNNDFRNNGRANNLLAGIALGYQVNNNLRFELAYSDNLNDNPIKSSTSYTKKTQQDTFSAMKSSTINASLQTTMLNAYYSFDNGSNFSPFITAGLGLAHINVSGIEQDTGADINNPTGDVAYNGSETIKGEKNNFAWNVGVGGSYQFIPNFYLDAMVSYVNTGKLNITGTAHINKNDGTTADFTTQSTLNVNAVNMLLGIRYVF